MKIYIASSWKNQHGVEMLTALLREQEHEVVSWVENNYGENCNHVTKKLPFDEWLDTYEAREAFEFDTKGATTADVLIYYSPAGMDACAELGAAWAKGVYTVGLWSKGENIGLMGKMVNMWCTRYTEVLYIIEQLNKGRIA